MKNYETEQEKFWAGEFGDAYIKRNEDIKILAAKTAFLQMFFRVFRGGTSVLALSLALILGLIYWHCTDFCRRCSYLP